MIEIVTHCYGKIYSELLQQQLQSLRKYPADAVITVCCSPKDLDTLAIVELFGARKVLLDEPYLLRRAHGRNLVAKSTTADCVWFCDADYSFGEGCLDTVNSLMNEDSGLCFPAKEWISKSKKEPDVFVPVKLHYAIGGAQIVGRKLCNRIGYLDGTVWVEPVDPKKGWRVTKCDYKFRHMLGTKGTPLQIPNVFRRRHPYAYD